MAIGFRVVNHSGPAHPDWVDWSSLRPDLEGDVVTEPGTTVSEPFYVWDQYQRLAVTVIFSPSWAEGDPGVPFGYRRLLVVDYEPGDILESVGVGRLALFGT